MLLGQIDPAADAPVRETWQAAFGNDFDGRWRQALRDGFVRGAASSVTADRVGAKDVTLKRSGNGLDVVFRPDPTIWDGQFANVGWLQELPKPLTTLTWDNVITISPSVADAHERGQRRPCASHDRRSQRNRPGLDFAGAGREYDCVFISATDESERDGWAMGSATTPIDIRPVDQPWFAKGSLRKLDGTETLAVTQLHHRMEGFDFVREVSADHPKLPEPRSQESFYPDWRAAENAWGMVIDLDLCIGCNACVSACTAENNVPVVGKEQVQRRPRNALAADRPLLHGRRRCAAQLFPAGAVHALRGRAVRDGLSGPRHRACPEGVNQMVYNRCIGTRTCSSYCPYKVRRFNFFDYRNSSGFSRTAPCTIPM